MGTITIRLNEEEEKIFSAYAGIQGTPLSTLFKKALAEKMENELDMKAIRDYEKSLETGDVELFTHEEVKKMPGMP